MNSQLLIAIMQDAYAKVKQASTVEFLRERAKVIMQLELQYINYLMKKKEENFPVWIHVLWPSTSDQRPSDGKASVAVQLSDFRAEMANFREEVTATLKALVEKSQDGDADA